MGRAKGTEEKEKEEEEVGWFAFGGHEFQARMQRARRRPSNDPGRLDESCSLEFLSKAFEGVALTVEDLAH